MLFLEAKKTLARAREDGWGEEKSGWSPRGRVAPLLDLTWLLGVWLNVQQKQREGGDWNKLDTSSVLGHSVGTGVPHYQQTVGWDGVEICRTVRLQRGFTCHVTAGQAEKIRYYLWRPRKVGVFRVVSLLLLAWFILLNCIIPRSHHDGGVGCVRIAGRKLLE